MSAGPSLEFAGDKTYAPQPFAALLAGTDGNTPGVAPGGGENGGGGVAEQNGSRAHPCSGVMFATPSGRDRSNNAAGWSPKASSVTSRVRNTPSIGRSAASYAGARVRRTRLVSTSIQRSRTHETWGVGRPRTYSRPTYRQPLPGGSTYTSPGLVATSHPALSGPARPPESAA